MIAQTRGGPLTGMSLRIGLMGQAVRLEDIMKLLSGLEMALITRGWLLTRGDAICEARNVGALFAGRGAPTGSRAITLCAA